MPIWFTRLLIVHSPSRTRLVRELAIADPSRSGARHHELDIAPFGSGPAIVDPHVWGLVIAISTSCALASVDPPARTRHCGTATLGGSPIANSTSRTHIARGLSCHKLAVLIRSTALITSCTLNTPS
jgi:hypothetical protein